MQLSPLPDGRSSQSAKYEANIGSSTIVSAGLTFAYEQRLHVQSLRMNPAAKVG
jgi:hypothetical protein